MGRHVHISLLLKAETSWYWKSNVFKPTVKLTSSSKESD